MKTNKELMLEDKNRNKSLRELRRKCNGKAFYSFEISLELLSSNHKLSRL